MGNPGKLSSSFYSRLAGRDKELEELKNHLTESINGRGRLVLIVGETGIGKSRLVEELGRYAESQNVLYLSGKSLYHENTEPYLPFIEAFSDYTAKERDFQGEDLRAVMGADAQEPFSLSLLPLGKSGDTQGMVNKAKLNLKQERDRLFEAIFRLVIGISENRSLLLALDDLQWADDGTLQVLHYLARNIRNNRVLICGTYCEEDFNNNGSKKSQLPETIRRMRIEKLFSEIKLSRLNESSTAQMIESLIGKQGMSNEFVKVLYNESEGNPFFVEEVLKSLINEGLIDVASYRWVGEFDASDIRIPKTIKDVIARRIDTLSEKSISILREAAAIGNSFTFDLLQSISGMDEEEVIDAIDSALSANLIDEDRSSKDERYRFDHALVREVLYSGMSKSRRRLLHKRIGVTMEKEYKGRIDEFVYNLAHHFNLGRDIEKTLLYAVLAGNKAASAFAPEDAIQYYVMALRALEQMDIKLENMVTRLGVVSHLGEIFNTIGEWDDSLKYQNEALFLSDKIGNDLEKARAHRNMGHIKQNKGEFEDAISNFTKSLDLSKQINDIHGLADTHRGLGRVYWRRGEFDKAIKSFDTGIDLTRKISDEKLMASTFIDLGNVYSELGNFEKALEYHLCSLKVLEKLEDFFEMGRSYNNIGVTYARQGDLKKAIEFYEKCIEISETTGNLRMEGWALFNAAEAYAKIGNLQKALDFCNRSLYIFEKLDEKLGISGSFMSYGIIYKLQKKWEEAIKYFEKSVNLRKELKIPYRLADGYFEFGLLYKDKGDEEKARDYLGRAKEIFVDLGAREFLERIDTEMKSIKA